jgi:hypothetical protein
MQHAAAAYCADAALQDRGLWTAADRLMRPGCRSTAAGAEPANYYNPWMNAGSTAPAAPPPTSRLKLKSRPPPPPSRESDALAALLTRDDEGRDGGGTREGVTNVGARDGVAATLLLLLPPPLPPPVRLLLTPAPHAEDTSCLWPVSCSSRSFTWADRPGLAVGSRGRREGRRSRQF